MNIDDLLSFVLCCIVLTNYSSSFGHICCFMNVNSG